MNARAALLLSASLLVSPIAAPSASERPPQPFERNHGQGGPAASFVTRGDGYEALLEPGAAAFSLPLATGSPASMRIRFAGAGAVARIQGIEELPGKVHYLGRWNGIPTYAAVTSADLYPGVTMTYRADFRGIDLELVVAPGADSTAVRLIPEGSDGFMVEPSSGDLLLTRSGARLRMERPVASQDVNGVATVFSADFVPRGEEIGLRVPGAEDDTTLRVRIRLTRDDAWRFEDSSPVKVATDPRGNVYVTGTSLAGAFVTKLRAGDLTPVHTTYLDDDGGTIPLAIAVDASGEAVVAGRDRSGAFAARLREDGSALAFSTHLGGGEAEARGVAIDERGTTWIAGRDSADAFVTRLDRDGSLLSTTRLGGTGEDGAAAIRVDATGGAIVAGTTFSADFPVDHALQPAMGGGSDGFVARLRSDGKIVWATYLGGSGDDSATGLDVDAAGSAVVTGVSGSVDFPRAPASGGAFVVKLGRDGAALVYAVEAGVAPLTPAVALGRAEEAWVADGTALSKLGPAGRLLSRSTRARAAADVATDPAGEAVVAWRAIEDDPAATAVQPARAGGLIYVVGPAEAPSAAGCPGTINFSNGAGTGLWQTAANWDLNRLPVITDDVCIGGTFSVTLSSGTQTADTLFVNAGASLQVSGGSLSVAAPSTINGGFTLSGGTLTGAGTVTIASSFGWSGGTMTGAGTVNANGGIAISGSPAKAVSSSRVLNTAGTVTWTGLGSIQVGTGGVVNNNGTWDSQSDATMSNPFGGTAAFNNNAGAGITFQKSAGSGTTNVTVPFNNNGVAKVLSGTVSFNLGGTSQGSFVGSPGTTLKFGGGTHSLGTNSIVNADTVVLDSGAVTIDGLYSAVAGTTASGAITTFDPACTVSSLGSALFVSSGTLTLNSGEAINPATLALSAGTIQGSDTVTISGLSSWSGGTMTGAGTINANGGIAISGSPAKAVSSSRVLNTAAATTWTGLGGIQIGTGGVVNNNGTWDCQSDATMSNPFGGTATFNNNSGTGFFFQKSAGTGTTNVSVPFNNNGVAKVLSGTISFNSGGTSQGSFTGSAGTTLAFGGGTHALTATSSVTADTVVLGGGTVTIDGSYAVTAGTTASGAIATFNAASTVSSIGSALFVSSGTLTFNSGEPINPATLALSAGTMQGSDTVTISGLTSWSGGTMTGAGTVNASGGIAISGSPAKAVSSSRVLNTAAATTWTGLGGIQIGTGGVINNNGTWDSQSDATMSNPFGGTAAFNNNAGTGFFFQKSAGSGTTNVSVPFNNNGVAKVLSGTLAFNSGGTSTGSFTGSAGTTLAFTGGTQALTGTSAVTADTVVLGGGTVTIDGAYAVTAGTTASGAIATFNAASTVSSLGSALFVSSGTLTLNSGEAINPATLALSAGTIQGSDTVTISGLSSWSGGTMTGAGTINANGGIAISGSPAKAVSSSRVLNTAAATTWTGLGGIQIGTGGVVNNNGTWDCQSDATMSNPFGGTATFNNNSGTGFFFQKSAGTGTTNVSVPFNNNGVAKVLSGTISFNSGGTSQGSFTGSAGTTLAFGGGTHALTATSSVTADTVVLGGGTVTIDGSYAVTAGTTASGAIATFNAASTVSSIGSALFVSSGTLTFNSGEPINPATLTLSGGTIQGSDTVTISGLSSWSGGTMTGAGTVHANGGITISGSAAKAVSSSRVLDAAGTVTWTGLGGIQVGTGAVVNNGGTWDCQSDAAMSNPFGGTAAFVNTGTFQKSAGTTTNVAISMTTSGAVQALAGTLSFTASTSGFTQNAGTTTLNGGTITSTTTMSFQGGTLQGAGTVAANLSSGGHVAPGLSPAILNETGTYTQTAAGHLDVEIGGLTAGTQYDRFAVSGAATLAGTLNATLINGFVPASGDTFTVLTYASRTGTFSTLNLPPLGPGWLWIPSYGATSFTLTVVLDSDGDGMPNAADCAPFDPGAFAVPLEVQGDALAADKQTISWTSAAPSSGTATVHDVLRGALRQFPVGTGGSETCLASGVGAASTTDAATPAPGAGVYYLVRGRNVCGTGTYGFATGGAQRVTAACP